MKLRFAGPGAVLLGVSLLAPAAEPAGGEAAREPLRETFHFPAPVPGKGKDFDRLAVPGLEAWGAPGAPALPARLGRIVLPPGRTAARVAVRPGPERRLDGRWRLEPAPALHRPHEDPVPPPPAPDPAVYDDPGPFPARACEELGIGLQRGRAVVLLRLSPVSYFPRSGAVAWRESIEVEVWTKPMPAAAPLPPPVKLGLGAGAGEEEIAYAIVTSPGLAPAFAPLAAARSRGGLPAAVFTTDRIYADYDGTRPDGGVDDATRIRNFIRDLYDRRGLRYVLLAGDADAEAGCAECGPVIVPTRYLRAFSTTPLASDLYFGCLDGTFDGDADGIYGETNDGDGDTGEGGGDVDLLFEVAVGRAPVDSTVEAENFVRKTLAYEESSGPVLREVLLVGERLGFGGAYDFGCNLNDVIRYGSGDYIYSTGFEDPSSPTRDFFRVRTLYDRDTVGQNWPPSALVAFLEAGVHLLNHVGHADISNVMKLTAADIDALGGGAPFLGYTQSCHAGAFDNVRADGTVGADSVVEHFLGGAQGAAAFVASSRRGWAGSGDPDGPSQRFNRWFWDAVLRRGVLRWGEVNNASKEESLAYTIGNERARWCYYTLNTLGDPALTIKLASRRGALSLDRPHYNPGTEAAVVLLDSDLNTDPEDVDRAALTVRAATSGDAETLELRETGLSSGVFQGRIAIALGPAAADGTLQVAAPDRVTAAYDDADAGGGAPARAEATALVTEALAFTGDCPPEAAVGVPYRAALAARGGAPPYRFEAETGYVEEVAAPEFEGLGERRSWNDDDGAWVYAPPFAFPFYGRLHERLIVSSNGYLELGTGNDRDFAGSAEKLIANARIAPLWADLVTAGGGDIYIHETLESATIRWRGIDYHNRGLINVEVELFADGRIRFGYGEGNDDLNAVIGISAGDGERYVISTLNGQLDLRGAPTVTFFPTRLPAGLAVDSQAAELSGFPAEVASVDVGLLVRDSLGQTARRRCLLTVRPDGLALESPRAGDLWLLGSRQTVRWQWFGSIGSRVRIDYNTDGSTTSFPLPVAASVPLGDRQFAWTLPGAPGSAAGTARLRIASVERPEFFTYSGVFSLVGPTLLLRAPAAGERWIVGGEAVVRWESLGSTGSAVRIEYNTDGSTTSFPLVLAASAPNAGEFRAPAPATPSETCRLRLTSLSVPGAQAVSAGLFAIRPPSLSLTAPNGGECLRIGEGTEVTWRAEGNTGTEVIIEYNTDGGALQFPFRVGVGQFPNNGRAVWTVPEAPSARARLRIRSASNPALTDISDGAFALDYRCALRALLWVPYIGIDEERVAGTLGALSRIEPDLEASFSTATNPSIFADELRSADALVILKQKHAPGVGAAELGRELGPVLRAFAGRGGAVVACPQPPQFEAFFPAAGLIDVRLVNDQGTGLCEVAAPHHELAAGVRPNFAGPLNTGWYEIAGPGALPVATAGGSSSVVAAARGLGFGRVSFLGFDYYSFNNDTALMLANAARVTLPVSGIRLTEPGPGLVVDEGEDVIIRWFARGAARGPVRLTYNTDGSTTAFPLLLADTAGSGDTGSYLWRAPRLPPQEAYLRLRIRVSAVAAPEFAAVLEEPFYVARPLAIVTQSLPAGSVGLAYETQVQAAGGVPPYTISITGLPAGLVAEPALGAGVRIAGVPQVDCEACPVEAVVRDAIGTEARRTFSLEVQVRTLRLLRPNGGELWLYGTSQEVTWQSLGSVGETVNLAFNMDGSRTDFPFVITASVPVRERFQWQLPVANAPRCRLRVQSNDYPEIFAVSSGEFAIVGPTVRLLAPNGGECWEPGRTRKIRWQSAGNPAGGVRIEYTTDSSTLGFPGFVAEGAPDTGEYVWTVPEELSDGYRVRVSFEAAPEIHAVSAGDFRVAGECGLSVLLWEPAGARGVAAIREALIAGEEGVEVTTLSAPSTQQIEGSLSNHEALVVYLDGTRQAGEEAFAQALAPALRAFVAAGGAAVLCGPGLPIGRFAQELGIAERLTLFFAEPGLDCRVAAPLHPFADGVPLRFPGPARTLAFRLTGSGWRNVVESSGLTVAAARDEGRGRWALLGFDFETTNPASARLLRNAARARPAADGLRLLLPQAGTVFTAGEEVPIEWAAQGGRSGLVRLAFNTDGSSSYFPHAIGEAPGGAEGGAFVWTAPAPDTGNYFPCRIEVRWADAPELGAHSEGEFYITRAPLRLETGALREGFRGAAYRSELRASGGAPPYTFRAVGLPAGLYAAAATPDEAAAVTGVPLETGTDLEIDVEVSDSLGSTAARAIPLDVFPSRLEVLSPAGGEFVLAGAALEIRWRIIGYAGDSLRIEYNLDGSTTSFPHVAAEAAPAAGSFLWQVPDAAGRRARVQLRSNDLGYSAASPRPFTITGPGITCLYPNGEETFETNTEHTLRWRSLGNAGARVTIEMNLDGSLESFPIVIASAAPDTGEYRWAPAGVEAESCRLRVRSDAAAELEDVSDGTFALRRRTPLRGLIWIPYTDFDRAEVRGAVAAVTLFENDFDWTLSKALTEAELERDLRGREAFIMVEQDPQAEVNFAGFGSALGHVLVEFARRGGAVVILKQRGAAYDFAAAAGLIGAREEGSALDIPCEVSLATHPVVAGVPQVFRAAAATGWFALEGDGVEVYATTAAGRPVAAGRDLGDGRVVLAGFDYRDYTPASARLLANAARAVPAAGRPLFVRGDGNADGDVDLSDAVFILQFLFLGGRAPPCLDAADVDDSAVLGSATPPINITDGLRLLLWLFASGPAPPLPTPFALPPASCGPEPSARDGLGCASYPPCAG